MRAEPALVRPPEERQEDWGAASERFFPSAANQAERSAMGPRVAGAAAWEAPAQSSLPQKRRERQARAPWVAMGGPGMSSRKSPASASTGFARQEGVAPRAAPA